jgi:thiamine biosynthesis protein ThiI
VYNSVVIRFGELFLKSEPVRRRMVHQLSSDLRSRFNLPIIHKRDFLVMRGQVDTYLLRKVPGVVSFSQAILCTPDEVLEKVLSLCKGGKTFAVRAKARKFRLTSQETERWLGEEVIKRFKLKVNLSKPDLTIYVEILPDLALVYDKKIPGLGGLPLGSAGRVLAVIRNRRDLLASILMLRRGCEIIAVAKKFRRILKSYGISSIYPSRSLAKEKVIGEVSGTDLGPDGDLPVYRPLVGLDRKELTAYLRLVE